MSFSAPAFSTKASVRALVRLKPAMRCPCSAMLSARLEPIVPRPIRPISAFSIVSSLLSDLVGWSPQFARMPILREMIDGPSSPRQPPRRIVLLLHEIQRRFHFRRLRPDVQWRFDLHDLEV